MATCSETVIFSKELYIPLGKNSISNLCVIGYIYYLYIFIMNNLPYKLNKIQKVIMSVDFIHYPSIKQKKQKSIYFIF